MAFFCGFILKSWSHSCYEVSLDTGTATTEARWPSTKDNMEADASFETGYVVNDAHDAYGRKIILWFKKGFAPFLMTSCLFTCTTPRKNAIFVNKYIVNNGKKKDAWIVDQ